MSGCAIPSCMNPAGDGGHLCPEHAEQAPCDLCTGTRNRHSSWCPDDPAHATQERIQERMERDVARAHQRFGKEARNGSRP